ncbi:hypothetical protein HYS93_04020 [Candidatus Daviesbacteria bacterium]|nr:hypothetical protein [Candidatus Daviesbacteria bacterium]
MEQPLPNVHIIEEVKKSSGFGDKLKQLFLTPKVIFVLLGLIILIEVVYGFKTLTSPRLGGRSALSLDPISSARLVLNSDEKVYKVGSVIPVEVRLSTAGHTIIASDVEIKYDPSILEATGSAFFNQGDVFDEFPNIEVDQQQGIVRFSALSINNLSGFNGTGELATLNLRSKKEGQTSLTVNFTPSSTIDSNVIEANTINDVLGQVFNLDLTISQKSSQDSSKEANTSGECESFRQNCKDSSDKPGIQECSFGRIKNNSCSYDPYLTESCGECISK